MFGPFVKTYQVIGYTYNASVYCLDHEPAPRDEWEAVHPVFAGDEWDYAPACDVCHEPLEYANVIMIEESR